MPEGHTIHRLARDLDAAFADEPLSISSPQGRFSDGAKLLDGRHLTRATARGKHLFLEFEDSLLHIHLGLIGKFRKARADSEARDSVRLQIVGSRATWRLTGPQTCAVIDPGVEIDIIERLGPDPLAPRPKPGLFVEALARRRAPIAATLLDQSVIAGVGNVYRAEFLFLHGIHPTTPSNAIDPDEVARMWTTIRSLMQRGVRLNRIVTVDPQDSPRPLSRLRSDERLYVYKRQGDPCRRCGAEITMGSVGNRSVWWCPVCQPG